ncbi:DNA topoisomerase-1 [Cognatiyoonia koreensis]|uniref:DNA topoisomerase n=1 Tax=Cognatiyoonia koreensis TaxID=364200 RepID=A0A1I0PY35_9RHOB|nr:DNA topoisomerase IB [Cognatiyoonia koreensis]SEW19441.1 DNA topoisomerase-1 [Cognatiyoonia koreensis]
MSDNPELIYVSDSDPGISRRRCGRGFSYIAPDGTTISRGAERKRIEALAVPPAYDDVWICAKPNGHLQATGRDVRERKQYRYHPAWAAARAETKFSQLAEFGAVLPRIRRRVRRDLEAAPGDLDFALAAAVKLIDHASLRVGSEDYTRENGTFGALTLRSRHLKAKKDGMELRYTGKGGAKICKAVTDTRLQRMLQKVNDVPGATLLTWIDDDSQTRTLSSQQLNAYLSDAAGNDTVTAKTFRTWAGTVAAFARAEEGGSTIKDLAKAASERLHNTPTVARNSYIHPAVIDLAGVEKIDAQAVEKAGLFAIEQRLLGFLTNA